MAQMDNTENKNIGPQNTEAFIADGRAALAEAVALVAGGSDADPTVVFRPAGEVRDDDKGLVLSAEQESQLREIAGRLGIGGERDVLSGADHQLLEGGKPWKIEAEVQIVGEGAKTILFAASPYRLIGQDEIDYMASKLPEDATKAKSEYEMARQIAEAQPGFQALPKDVTLASGYDINNQHTFVAEATGQFVHIGSLRGAHVVMLRVDRENYSENDGTQKYRNQPDGAALLTVFSDALAASGDTQSSIGFNTSSTYASRSVDTMRAGLRAGRDFFVGMYGRQTLAGVQGLEVAEPSSINQIPGELHTYASKLDQLTSELGHR